MMVRGIFFDVGGVLISNNHMDALKWVAKRIGADESSCKIMIDDFKRGFTKAKTSEYRTVSDVMQDALNTYRVGLNAKKLYIEYISDAMTIRPNVKEVLENLKEKFKTGIITNTDDILNDATLKKFGLKGFFYTIVTAEMARAYKTNKVVFKIACKKMGFAPQETLWVGNSMDDNANARAVGMLTALVGVEGDCDYKISNIEELSCAIKQ
jgi:HAD superfamily hydrolase (TIGR01549 family)